MKLIIIRLSRTNQLRLMKFVPIFEICILVLFPSLFTLPTGSTSAYHVETNPIYGNGITKRNNYRVDLSSQLSPPRTLRFLDSVTWEPYPTFDSADSVRGINSLIFDSLVAIDFSTRQLVPNLASQWVASIDSKQWIFTLREDVVFHDGEKFNASAVKYNFDRFIDPSHPAYFPEPYLGFTEMPFESTEIIEEFKVAINLNTSFAAFINTFGILIDIVSPKSFQGSNISSPIGTGPYIFNSVSSNNSYINLTRNTRYHRGVPPFETIDYLMFDNDEDLKRAIANHDGDFVPGIGQDQWDANDSYFQTGYYGTSIDLVYFNHSIPELSDARVRKAINYAINKDESVLNSMIIQPLTLTGERLPLLSIIPQGMIFHDDTIQGFPYNVTEANKLLDEAGYPRDTNGYRFTINLTTIVEEDGKIIASFLDAVGIKSEIILLDIYERFERFITGNYDMLKIGWMFLGEWQDPAKTTRMLLHSSGTGNTGGYSSSQIDNYILLGQQTPIHQEREFYYKMVQQLAQEEAPYLLLSQWDAVYLLTPPLVPFISKSGVGIDLNFTNGVLQEFSHQNVEISEVPIYLPFTDVVVESTPQFPLHINITMNHNSKTFFPKDDNEVGKFFEIEIDNIEAEYKFRSYYDNDELHDQSNLEQLALYRWDQQEKQWKLLKTVASNTSLRYIKVNLKGGYQILKLAEIMTRITHQYFPLVFLIIGGTLGLTIITVVINRFTLQALKKRYGL